MSTLCVAAQVPSAAEDCEQLQKAFSGCLWYHFSMREGGNKVFLFWKVFQAQKRRSDISRLPFASHIVDAVHAGAALHCWPSPSAAVAEISRLLEPGGIFPATTYIL